MRPVCSGVPPTGFSQKTCLPACGRGDADLLVEHVRGRDVTTTSTSGWSMTSLPVDRSPRRTRSRRRHGDDGPAALSAHSTRCGVEGALGEQGGEADGTNGCGPGPSSRARPPRSRSPASAAHVRGSRSPLAFSRPFRPRRAAHEVPVMGHRGSAGIPAHVSRTQWWAGSSQNAMERSPPGPARTFR